MKRTEYAALPLHDYSPALQDARSWLGDKYLLAEPLPRLNEERRPYSVEQRRWHPVVMASALAKVSR